MAGGAIVVDEERGLRSIVRLEAADELHRSAVEGVDVLVVVTYREESELAILLVQGSSREGRNQFVLFRVDVLILVHQDPAEAGEKAFAPLVGLLLREVFAAQLGYRLPHHFLERLAGRTFGPSAEARSGEAHRKAVACEHGHPARVVADQIPEPAPDLDRRVPVVGEGEDAARVLASDPHQKGDPMDEHTCLAGTGTGEDQNVRLLSLICHDPLLDGMFQALDDGPPRFGRGRAPNLPISLGKPEAKEVLLLQTEVVHGELQRVGHLVESPPRELHHHMDLAHLPLVVELEGLEVGGGEAAPRLVVSQPKGHGRAEHGETLVETDDLLLVQPEQGPLEKLLRILDPALEFQVPR